ncbi:MAG: RNA polymerase sigma factor [Defluviitaleaceae bacterium]|nr:RNA polymerase sigma factor [Defluviitaleaceae bacterium]
MINGILAAGNDKKKRKENHAKLVRLYEEYYSLMMSVAIKILKDHALSEDAVADSFEKLLRHIHKIGDVTCYKTKAFVVITVKNTALDMLKKMKRIAPDSEDMLDEIADYNPDILSAIVSQEGHGHIVNIIDALTPALRDVAVLSLLHGLSSIEISKLLGLSDSTARMRLSRARKAVISKLKDDSHE